jgi:hypothetical protein
MENRQRQEGFCIDAASVLRHVETVHSSYAAKEVSLAIQDHVVNQNPNQHEQRASGVWIVLP